MTSDRLQPERLRAQVVRPGGRWRELEVVPETGSTNADLAERFRRAEPSAGAVLLTEFQSAGRGRRGRTWTAPPGSGIVMSALLVPERSDGWTRLPLLAGLAVADGLRSATGVDAVLKWPNDVLVGDAKLCGVLAERVVTPAGAACVLGMGVNVHLRAEQLPVPTATSLAVLQPGVRHDRGELVVAVLAVLELLLGRWESGAEDGLRAAYEERCRTLGRRVEVQLGEQQRVTGTATGVDADGRLLVRTATGEQVLGAGDVVHLR